MRIHRVQVENFGKLHKFQMELKDGCNVICAANGWGKSTLAAFIKAMFYGLAYTSKRSLENNERKRYLPWQGGPFGGSLEFSTEKKVYRVERFFGAKDKEDTFALYDLDTGLSSEDYSENLGEELFCVDRKAFERSSFFIQQNFSAAINDSLSARLTCVEEEAGDMKNYEKAVASLEEKMKYYKKTGNRGQIGRLEERRSALKQELADCQKQEEEMLRQKELLSGKRQEMDRLSVYIKKLQAEFSQAQRYGERAARKDQYDLLKGRALEEEAGFRRILTELKSYEDMPPGEEELDRCREEIYRLHILSGQETAAAKELKKEKRRLTKLKEDMEEISSPGKRAGILALVLVISGVCAMFLDRLLPGVGLILSGAAAAFVQFYRISQSKREKDALKKELSCQVSAIQDAEKNCQAISQKKESLERKVSRFLQIPQGAGQEKMELIWKQARQKSQEYGALLQACKSAEENAKKSKAAYVKYIERFSKEELEELLTLQRPEAGTESSCAEDELEQCLRQREVLSNACRDIYNRIENLREQTEQIRPLQEEETRLLEELSAAVREHGLLEKTLEYLKTARDQFGVRYLKELKQGLEYYMRLMEPMQKVEPSLDVRLKLKIKEAGAVRSLESLSAGWQDLLQIAERLAIVDALYKEEQPVLILDDPFVNLDTDKKERATALLNKLANKRQILYFTCRE